MTEPDMNLQDVFHLSSATPRVELDAHPLDRLRESDAVVAHRRRLVGMLALHPRVMRRRRCGDHSLGHVYMYASEYRKLSFFIFTIVRL